MSAVALRGLPGGRLADVDGGLDAAVAELAAGRVVLLVDTERGAGWFVAVAGTMTTGALAFIAAHGRGVLTAAVAQERLDELGIPRLPGPGALHMPVEVVLPGESDDIVRRAATLRALGDPSTAPESFETPGSVFPVGVTADGVLGAGHPPEAAADLLRLAGLGGAAVLRAAADEQGHPADPRSCARLARRLGLSTVSVREVAVSRRRTEPSVQRRVQTQMPTAQGVFTVSGYESDSGEEHVAFVHGDPAAPGLVVHIHARCAVGDLFGGLACGCGEQLQDQLRAICAAGDGVVVYSAGLGATSQRHLTDHAPVSPGDRDGHAADVAHILDDLGVTSAFLTANQGVDLTAVRAIARARVEGLPTVVELFHQRLQEL